MTLTSSSPGETTSRTRWEYCLLNCTPISGLGDGYQVRCRLIGPGSGDGEETVLTLDTAERSPQTAIVQVLNELGQMGWELVNYDLTTHRALFKRPVGEPGGMA